MVSLQVYWNTGDDRQADNNTAAEFDLGQQFTTTNAFTLSFIKLYLLKAGSPGATYTASIYATDGSGFPTGAALSTGTFPTSSLSGSAAWITINMSPVNLSANTKYAIMLTGTHSSGNYIAWRQDSSSGYPGGQSIYFQSTYQNDTSTRDNLFEVYGSTPSTTTIGTKLLRTDYIDKDYIDKDGRGVL